MRRFAVAVLAVAAMAASCTPGPPVPDYPDSEVRSLGHPAEAPRLAKEDAGILLRLARARIGNVSLREKGKVLRALEVSAALNAASEHKVLVTAWPAKGRPVTRMADSGTLGLSALAAAQLVRNDAPDMAARLARVQVDVAYGEEQGALEDSLLPGIEGLGVQIARRPAAVPPARYLADDPGFGAFVAVLARELGLSRGDLMGRHPAALRFRTVAFVEPPRGRGALPVFRGNVLLKRPDRKAFERAASAAQKYLAGCVRQDGRFVGERHPVSGREAVNENLIHHAYAAWMLSAADSASLAFLRRKVKTAGEIAYVQDARNPTLGTAAVTALALIQALPGYRWRRPSAEADEVRRFGRFLLRMQGADGRFHYAWGAAKGQPSAGFVDRAWPGQAILALLALAEADAAGAKKWREAAARSARHEAARSDDPDEAPDPWRLLALARAGLAVKESHPEVAKAAASAAFRLADRACRLQVRSAGGEPDLLGGVPVPDERMLTALLTASLAEAVAGAHKLARASGDAGRARRYAGFVRGSAHFLLGQQYREENLFVVRDEARYLGGVRAAPVVLAVYLDVTAHALAAFRAAAALGE